MTTAQTETALTSRILDTWNNVRSSHQIQTFLERRELALEGIPIGEDDDKFGDREIGIDQA